MMIMMSWLPGWIGRGIGAAWWLVMGLAATGWAAPLLQPAVVAAVTERLQTELDRMGGGFRVTEVHPRGTAEIGPEPWTWQISRPAESPVPGRKEWVAVTVQDAAGKVVTLNVEARYSQRVQGLGLRRTLQRGESLSPEDLEEMTVDLPRPRPELVLAPQQEELLKRVAMRTIRAGQPLENGWFELPCVIKRGDRVRLIYTTRNLTIEGVGSAAGNGRVGDVIQVMNTKSMKRLQARVIGPGEAMVE